MSRRLKFLAGLVLAVSTWTFLVVESIAEPATSVESWTDRRLPVTRGLALWLDASRLAEGRKALGMVPVKDGAPVDCWPDGSGTKRHLRQEKEKARPISQSETDFRALRFDGLSKHLILAQPPVQFRELTVFVVAAPFANPDAFSAILGMSAEGKNDYQTGFNIDQGTGPIHRFAELNAEGAGTTGMKNLLNEPAEFGTVMRLCVTTSPGKDGIVLWSNGKRQGARDRRESAMHMDRFVVGGRYYTNGGPPEARGFFEGDIAEVLIFDRALTDTERTAVDTYLKDKYAKTAKVALPGPSDGKRLVRMTDPPPVQVLVPGFSARQLPVDLTNINNVLYREDGKLVTLAYDGNVYLLTDSDGDGLEDKVELFWKNPGKLRGPIGMALTPPGDKHGRGLYLCAKGICTLIVDTDGDDKADKEIVVATGWEELPVAVDAVGVAVDPKDGSVYFGRGTQDYSDAYGVGSASAKRYDIAAERGTILRVAPDFKSREIVATGIRFPVGIRFNAQGDLFCTDQEGATWLPNGNPFDELLHIQKGRHYGFPPRHPKHLPKVIDEPSVFDYGPQHQCATGLNFNEPVNGGPVFGPSSWQSDVFVAGYSRGKIYRTQLVKTPAGYVARNQIFACLNMLTSDVCVSPKGELVVPVHSGGPDWGTGPTGKGKLYKIAYTGDKLAQPVMAWTQSPREIRVAFDRPLTTEQLAGLQSGVSIEYGRYVAAGDRYEVLLPGYKVVQDQLRTPRFDLPVYSVSVTPDQRTLIVATAPHPEAAGYAVTIRGLGRSANDKGLPQLPETDLRYDLSGVQAVWRSKDGAETWEGWLPHVELDVAKRFTKQSAGHDDLWSRMKQPGELRLKTTLNLLDMLRPAIQPGATIDYKLPAESTTVTFRSNAPFYVQTPDVRYTHERTADGQSEVTMNITGGYRVPIEIVLPTGRNSTTLSATWHTAEDTRRRAFPIHRFALPWAPTERKDTPESSATDVPELKGGNWARGRKVFFSEQAACSKCHTVRGEGTAIGPDLTNLPHRDYGSVHRDIVNPNFAINPDYITHRVVLKNGRVLTGAIRTEGDKLSIGDEKGNVESVVRSAVEEFHPTRNSIMPEKVEQQIGAERLRDLMVFLLTDPPRMPDYGRGQPPEPRSRKELIAVLAAPPDAAVDVAALRIALIDGEKDHGPGEHDYPAWQKTWKRLLGMAEYVEVTTAREWPGESDLKSADVLVFFQRGTWTSQRAADIDAFLARGGGLVYIHWAVDGGGDAPGFAQRIGLASDGPQRTKYRHGPLDLGFTTGSRHPIGRNFERLHLHDESYWRMIGDPKRLNLLANGKEDGELQPLFWTLEPSKGRVFVSIPGHFSWTFDDPLYRVFLLRGIAWTAREPVDRFNDLAVPGARIKD